MSTDNFWTDELVAEFFNYLHPSRPNWLEERIKEFKESNRQTQLAMKQLTPELKQQIEKEAEASAQRQDNNYPADSWEPSEAAERGHKIGYELGAEKYALQLQQAKEQLEKMARALEKLNGRIDSMWNTEGVSEVVPDNIIKDICKVQQETFKALTDYNTYKQQKDGTVNK